MVAKFISLIKNNQRQIILTTGFVAVAASSFVSGRYLANPLTPPEIKTEQAFTVLNNNPNDSISQPVETPDSEANNCLGKIKGNISSGGEKIYHLPTGSFYKRTIAEMCFDTEDQSKAAGFRKSSR